MKTALLRVAAFFIAYNLIMYAASVPKGMAPRWAADIVWGGLSSLGIYALTLYLLAREQRSSNELGIVPTWGSASRLVGGLLIGLAVWGAQMGLISLMLGPLTISAAATVPSVSTWLAIVASFLALSAMEELGFRAYLLRTLIPALGVWPTQLAVAALFGLWHLVFGWPWQTVLLGVIPSGLLFGVMAVRSNGMAMPIGLHAALNIGLWSVGAKDTPGAWILDTSPAHTARVETFAPLVGMAVTLLATAVIARWPSRRGPRAADHSPLSAWWAGCVMLAAACSVAVPSVTVAQRAPRPLNDLLEPIRQDARVPALGAAVVTSHGLMAIGTVGVRAAGAAPRVAADDLWHLGSCTKALTAVLVARLVDRGVLRWDATVAELWPETTRHAAWDGVTVAQLLAHRGGMPNNPDDSVWESVVRSGAPLPAQRARIARALFAVLPVAPADSTTIYSNAAFIAVGAMLERRTGASWETLMRREVFAPLAMRTAGFGVPGSSGRTGQPRGHLEDSTGLHPVPFAAGADNPPVTGPAGTVHASLPDWARFVSAILRGARGDTTYLSRAQWRRVLQPFSARADYALGWKRASDSTNVGFTLEHLGSNGFWVAQASLAPARGVAVLLTSNAAVDRLEQPFKTLTRVLGDSALVWCGGAVCR